MSDEKISAMPAAAALTGAELVPVVQGGANVKATAQNIANLAPPPPPPTVTITKGTTATSGFAIGDILISAAGPVVSSVADVAVNQVLASGGVGAAATWTGTPVVTSIQFGSGTALNDYEEGTWTPTDASGAGLSFFVNRAVYTKIGRLVTLQMNVSFPLTGNGSGARVGSLPFGIVLQATPISPIQANSVIAYSFANSPGTAFSIVSASFAAILNSAIGNGILQAGNISYSAT